MHGYSTIFTVRKLNHRLVFCIFSVANPHAIFKFFVPLVAEQRCSVHSCVVHETDILSIMNNYMYVLVNVLPFIPSLEPAWLIIDVNVYYVFSSEYRSQVFVESNALLSLSLVLLINFLTTLDPDRYIYLLESVFDMQPEYARLLHSPTCISYASHSGILGIAFISTWCRSSSNKEFVSAAFLRVVVLLFQAKPC